MTTVDGIYTPSSTPKKHPRIRPEAASNAERNRGNMERWFDYSDNVGYESPRPAGRSVTNEGRANAELNKGSMSEIMGGYADPPLQRNVHPRAVKGEAQDIANQNKGGAMRDLIDNYGKMDVNGGQNGPKVLGDDALEYAERNQGSVNKLMDNYGALTPDQPPPQKVSYGGEEVAAKHMGAGMGPLLRMEGDKTPVEPKQGKLHQTSDGPGWDEDPPAVRMRPEAEGIADKQTSEMVSNLMRGEVPPPRWDEDPPAVRMRPEAEGIADKQTSEMVGNLMRGEVPPPTERDLKLQPHMQTSVTPRPQTSPQRTRPEAMNNYQKNQSSEMSAILHGEASQARPARKQNRMMERSELW